MVKDPILSCTGLSKSYLGTKILDDLSFDLDEREIIAIIGPSGSGKTTFLKCLNLLISPDKGNVSLGGEEYLREGAPLFALNEIRENIGLVFQDFNLFPNLTCFRNITLAAEIVKGMKKNEASKLVYEISEMLNIVDVLQKYPGAISGGQAQRVSLARALILDPKVLMLDEITSALDPLATVNTMNAILKIRDSFSDKQMGLIFVTHYLNFAIKYSDRILYLKDGKFVENHCSAEFMNKCKDESALAYLAAASNFSS